MELIDKAAIITDLVVQHGSDQAWSEYFERNDIGPFLSICVVSGMVQLLSADGEATIEESYQDLLNVAGADDQEYSDLDTLLGIDRSGSIDLDDLKWKE
jgi:hypothetical protein